MNIIMTGSTSFVGAATVRELLRRGHTVTAIVRPKSSKLDTILEGNEEALLSGRLLVTENDLSEPEKLLEKVTKPQDVFCHFGWGGSGSASRTDKALQEKNMEISLETIRTAKALGCKKFLFSGSQAEYGMHQDLITENTVCEPKSLYGEAKLAMREKGEKLCDELGLRYIHARIFSAYGPGDHPWTLVESCLDIFLSNKEMSLGACTQKWNFLYIDDLARGMAALCEAPESAFEGLENPVFNFGGAETKVLKDPRTLRRTGREPIQHPRGERRRSDQSDAVHRKAGDGDGMEARGRFQDRNYKDDRAQKENHLTERESNSGVAERAAIS